MFVLVEYNKNYSDVCLELSKLNYTPITIFKLRLNGKSEIISQMEKIRELKSRITPKFSAIQVQLDKMENTSVGTVNSLRNDFDIVIGLGGLNKINRFFFEDTLVDFVRDPHNVIFRSKMDFIHHQNSGINHVLCKLAHERDIGMFFSLNFVLGEDKNKTKEFGRVSQNIKFCQKYKVPVLLSFAISNVNQIKTCNQLKKISSLFNLSSQMAAQSISILEDTVKKNKFRLSSKHIIDGIRFK
jgi:RNase P/RNase MRP subunit p30